MALTQEDLQAIRSLMEANNKEIVDTLREEITNQNNETQMMVENGYQRIENLLREDYGRVANAANKVADYDEVKGKVAGHDRTLESHNERISKLEKTAI